jgi:hypothetical protein
LGRHKYGENREKEKEDGQKGDDDETKWRRGTTTS